MYSSCRFAIDTKQKVAAISFLNFVFFEKKKNVGFLLTGWSFDETLFVLSVFLIEIIFSFHYNIPQRVSGLNIDRSHTEN